MIVLRKYKELRWGRLLSVLTVGLEMFQMVIART